MEDALNKIFSTEQCCHKCDKFEYLFFITWFVYSKLICYCENKITRLLPENYIFGKQKLLWPNYIKIQIHTFIPVYFKMKAFDSEFSSF